MLNSFNSIVLNVAIITLIILLIIIAVVINNSIRGQDIKFPPVVGTCPDYWSAIDESGNTLCYNHMNIGHGDKFTWHTTAKGINILQTTSMCSEFLTSQYPAVCDKYSLAKSCNLTWDGITNNTANRSKC